jgi:hypothetical protein
MNTFNTLNQVIANQAVNASKLQGYNIENADLISKAPGGSGRGLNNYKYVNASNASQAAPLKVSNSEKQFLSMIFTPEELDESGAAAVDLSGQLGTSYNQSKQYETVYGNKKQFESFQKSTGHMKSIDLSNVNKTAVSMNRSRSLKQKFKTKFGNETEKDD